MVEYQMTNSENVVSIQIEHAVVSGNRELQPATEDELGALLPSVLDRAFKGEP